MLLDNELEAEGDDVIETIELTPASIDDVLAP